MLDVSNDLSIGLRADEIVDTNHQEELGWLMPDDLRHTVEHSGCDVTPNTSIEDRDTGGWRKVLVPLPVISDAIAEEDDRTIMGGSLLKH